jgi:rhamnose transport system permease protein
MNHRNSGQLLVAVNRYRRELGAVLAYVVLLVLASAIAPLFFSLANWRDLVVNNVPVLIVAVGMTLVILVAEIDISVGSQFAILSLAAAWLAKAGMPLVLWVQDLPGNFQWFGLGQRAAQILMVFISVLVLLSFGWGLRSLGAGRAIYAVGANPEAARLVAINPGRVVFSVFLLMGVLTALASILNAARFSAVPGNAGVGLELKVIAAVIVGGTAIRGGRGSLFGTLAGVALLGTIGSVLTFAGINPFWEKAIQGAIILSAAFSQAAFGRLNRHGRFNLSRAAAARD